MSVVSLWLEHVSFRTDIKIYNIRIKKDISFCNYVPLCFDVELPGTQPYELKSKSKLDPIGSQIKKLDPEPGPARS